MAKIIEFLKKNWLLILIILIAAGLRFYKLDTIPPGLYPDEAANGQDVIRILEGHEFKAIYDTNGPREALFLYLQAFVVLIGKVFHIAALNYTTLSLRIAPAFIGTLTVWAIYLFAKELFHNKEIGILSAAALALSSWHIQFSRNGFRAIMLPLMLCLIFYFFIKAYREGKLKDYLWFGAFLGLGFYTYLSIRMLPLAFAAFLIWTAIFDRKFLKENYRKIFWAGGAFLVVMIPMIIHFVQVPADIFGRASTSIFNPELNNGSALDTLLSNIKKEFLMFNFSGDKNFRHNVAGLPMLEIATGIFMWAGMIISLINIKKIEHFLLLSLFAAMSVPMVITAEGIPHALRLVGIIPVVFVWIGLGLEKATSWIKKPYLKYGILALVLTLSGYMAYQKYFILFPNKVEAREAYTEDMVSMAEMINQTKPGTVNYMVTGEFGLKTVYFLTYENNPRIIQMETYQIETKFKPDGSSFNIYVTPAWFDETIRKFQAMGYMPDFEEVKSNKDGRTLYYVSKN